MSIAVSMEMSALNKEKTLKMILMQLQKVAVCFSGGLDSTLLLKESIDVLGESNVLVLVAKSPVVVDDDVKYAESFLKRYTKSQKLFIERGEMEQGAFLTNDEKRCYYCKKLLFKKARPLAEANNFENIVDGTNLDDVSDYRPGIIASSESGVRSPLKEAHLKKEEIRILAKKLGIEDADRVSTSCYATRIPYYEPITFERIETISRGESYIKFMGFKNVRLRYHGELAKIEIDEVDFPLIMEKNTREAIHEYMKTLGFTYTAIDIIGYRRGSMNETIQQQNI